MRVVAVDVRVEARGRENAWNCSKWAKIWHLPVVGEGWGERVF
jgi:hypothetical protein